MMEQTANAERDEGGSGVVGSEAISPVMTRFGSTVNPVIRPDTVKGLIAPEQTTPPGIHSGPILHPYGID